MPELASATGVMERPAAPQRKRRGHWQAVWRRLARSPLFYLSATLLVVMVGMAVAPGLFAPADPQDCDLGRTLADAGAGQWFGRDLQGCDVFSRSVHGARASLGIGIAVSVVTGLLGGVIGATAGYFGGWVDATLSRITEIFLAIPLLLGASVLLTLFGTSGSGMWTVIIALSVHGWPQVARITRSSVMEAKQQDYMLAAAAIGCSRSRALIRHVVPNSLGPWLVVVTTNLGVFITYESIISMLGIGLRPPTISWGQMIHDAQARFLEAPLPLLGPALFLSVTVLAFILLGDVVRDAIDPRIHS
ncbi:ABC-type dipeptide/oligopeptide/nickel transport system permease subunit [Streptosporangium album]|uniref:ABC-type dipeptide/oligopeptide/nickel transport system permease subunit n=1 Tax=Streptosporangium album TaxID=47479 RepID=A0A7W7RT22_9ACTN|nr:ABC transporter permease [Streptosporangium album]MBB4937667.1 ABC-type dipeptide/oligopeptide/nickel transport system permease subunit [Streptosporangium album]